MDTIKIVSSVIGIVIAVLSVITGITFVATYFSNQYDDQKFARTIQCKQLGGQITYENYTWVCK